MNWCLTIKLKPKVMMSKMYKSKWNLIKKIIISAGINKLFQILCFRILKKTSTTFKSNSLQMSSEKFPFTHRMESRTARLGGLQAGASRGERSGLRGREATALPLPEQLLL